MKTAESAFLLIPLISTLLAACSTGTADMEEQEIRHADPQVASSAVDPSAADHITRTDAEWRALLTPEQYRITRQKGTERSGTGAYAKNKRDGTYLCIGCDLPLFSSETKFDSRTGWPSYWAPIDGANVVEERDSTIGMVRTEILCRRCDSHLGHVFNDGPAPTGLRYCVNSAALKFVEG